MPVGLRGIQMDPSKPPPHRGNKPTRIIVADDQRIVREFLCMLTVKAEPDMEVIAEAASGREALVLTRELLPDIVIMNLSMPELNGIEATHQLLSISPWVRVIALTMHSDRQFVLVCLGPGPRDICSKHAAKKN